MGGGAWTKDSFSTYASSRGRTLDSSGAVKGNYSAQDMYNSRRLAPELDPKGVMRECCDTEEHPETIPVILALDVTGSMGGAAVEVAKKLNVVMTELYQKVKDVEFLIMGIGDLAYDDAPIQASQFESDIRIAEQLDKIYFEGGGGGNAYESYTAAWYFGLHHTKLDCWERGRKGIIITIGDEPLNPYLPVGYLKNVTGDNLQGNVDTEGLYDDASKKFDIYHLAVKDKETSYERYAATIRTTFGRYLDSNHLLVVNMDTLATAIVKIITEAAGNSQAEASAVVNSGDGISW